MLDLQTRPARSGRSAPFAALALAAALVLSPSATVLAQGLRLKVDKKPDDPRAVALLADVVKAYQALKAYSDKGEFKVEITLDGKPQKQSLPLALTLVRPDKLDLHAGPLRLNSDGQTLTTSIEPLKRYTSAPAPKTIGLDVFREGAAGAVLFGGASGTPMFVLINLLVSKDPAAALKQLGGSLQLSAQAEKDQAPALLIDMEEAPDLLLGIDPATKLLSRIDLKVDAEKLAASLPAGKTLSIQRFGWSAGAVDTTVAPDRSFAFHAPEGFSKVDSLLQRGPQADEGPKLAHAEIGKPAPDFTLTVLDGPGKTKTISRADLAGKVVVIDFWATWCGPCLKELPEIQKLIQAHGDHKDVFVVALSQDNDPTELAAVRKLVEKTLSEQKIDLLGKPAGHIALDPSNSVGNAFGVEGYPTLVILDGKGVLQSIHVGYDPSAAEPFHKELGKEIDQLLAGKSLARPQPEKKAEAGGKPAAGK